MDTQVGGRLLRRPADTEAFRQLAERIGWTERPGVAAGVLGRNRKTVRRWFRGELDVEPSDLALMRRIAAFLDRARDLYESEPGDMTAEEFRAAIYAFGWNVRPRNHPGFSTVTGLPSLAVRLMAKGLLPVPQALGDDLRALMAELDEEPMLAALLQAREQHDDLSERPEEGDVHAPH